MTPSTDTTHPLEIPELLSFISSHLQSTNDLASACRVNKTWLRSFAFQLYRVINTSFWNHKKNNNGTENCDNDTLLKALERNSIHIRKVYCPKDLSIHQLSPFPELTRLTAYSGPEVSPCNIDLQVSILEQNSTSLEKVHIEWHNIILSNDLIKTLSSLKNLNSLDLTSVLIPSSAIEYILHNLPALEHLGISDLDLSESWIGHAPRPEVGIVERQAFPTPVLSSFSSSSSSLSPSTLPIPTKSPSYKLKSLSMATYELVQFSLDLVLGIMASSPDLLRLEFTERCKQEPSEGSTGFRAVIDALHDQPKFPAIKDLILNGDDYDLGFLLCRQDPNWPNWSMFLPEYVPRPRTEQFLTLRTLHLTADKDVGNEVAIIAIWAGYSALGNTLEDLKIMDNDDKEDFSVRVSGELSSILCCFSRLRSVVLNKVMVRAKDLFKDGRDLDFESESESESESDDESESEDVRYYQGQDAKGGTENKKNKKDKKELTVQEKKVKMLERMQPWSCYACLEHLEIFFCGEDSLWSPHSIVGWQEMNAGSMDVTEVVEYDYMQGGDVDVYNHVRALFASMPKLNQSRIGYTWE